MYNRHIYIVPLNVGSITKLGTVVTMVSPIHKRPWQPNITQNVKTAKLNEDYSIKT